MSKKSIIIILASFVIGLAEALVYYNLGKESAMGLGYSIPPARELLITTLLVIITSIATALLTHLVERLIEVKKRTLLHKYLIRK